MPQLPQVFNDLPWLLPVLVLWSMIWKGLALWRASHNESKHWFIALLVISTFGILEILYLYVWGKKSVNTKSGNQIDQNIFQK